MYNELKMLLSLQPHPNIISRPVGVVTRKGRFGNRRGVCGFLLEWLPLGSLRERLLWDGYEEHTSMEQRLRWARQVTEAFVHVNGLANAGFYPDLKPDNVVLRENAATGMLDAVLIDFEQRGGWFAWSPPEVKYLEYLEILADDSGLPDGDLKEELLGGLRAYYDDPDWLPGTSGRGRYHNTEGGFSSPWLTLLERRKTNGEDGKSLERAQVFMLGKLLWCIFEGQPLVRCGIDHEMLLDSDPEYESKRSGRARAFPEFNKTPPQIRQLIRTCTAGAPEWEDGVRLPAVVIRKGKFYPAMSGPDLGAVTAADTFNAARSFWGYEVERARAFMRTLLFLRGSPQDGSSPAPVPLEWLDQARTRPLFAMVLKELGLIEGALGL
jgi:serine/threonine protein kinase